MSLLLGIKNILKFFDLNTELSPDQELLEHIKFRRFILNKTLPDNNSGKI